LIYRHGDRTPIATFKTDPNRNSWSQGFGELTTVIFPTSSKILPFIIIAIIHEGIVIYFLQLGMQQQFDFGKQLRKMYVDEHQLLSYTYNPNEAR
jgi:hypothetical protein